MRVKDSERQKQDSMDERVTSEKIIDELQDEVSTYKVKLRSYQADKERLAVIES